VYRPPRDPPSILRRQRRREGVFRAVVGVGEPYRSDLAEGLSRSWSGAARPTPRCCSMLQRAHEADAHSSVREDAHHIRASLPGASWQRCRTHYLRDLLTKVAKSSQPWVATLVRTIFDQPDATEVQAQFERVVRALEAKLPVAAAHLEDTSLVGERGAQKFIAPPKVTSGGVDRSQMIVATPRWTTAT